MIYLKSCPKCHGDLALSRDSYGTFMSCIQCGLMRDIDLNTATTATAREPARVPVVYQEEQLAKAA